MKKSTKLYSVLTGIIIIIVYFLANSTSPSTKTPTPQDISSEKSYNAIGLFGTILYTVKEAYYKDIAISTLVGYAIEGMLERIDPYSSYIKDETLLSIEEYTKGEFSGIGIRLFKNKHNYVEVSNVLENSPAQKSGIVNGDYLTHINHTPVGNMSINTITSLLRGKVGSKVQLDLMKKSKISYHPTVIRENIKIDPIIAKFYQNILYIKIPSFNITTTADLTKTITQAFKGNSVQGVVLDLRNNPGGLFDQALSVSDLFLNKAVILSLQDNKGSKSQYFMATDGDILNALPLVILVDKGSASSAEIVAGSLQDHKRAVLVGTKTFGKGVIQNIIPVNKDEYIKITTAEYLLPNGERINRVGIPPDVVVFKNGKICQFCSDAEIEQLEIEENLYVSSNTQVDYQLNYALKIIKEYNQGE